jgi:hypothetical protein
MSWVCICPCRQLIGPHICRYDAPGSHLLMLLLVQALAAQSLKARKGWAMLGLQLGRETKLAGTRFLVADMACMAHPLG